ncbi:10798_t:CDS:2 [Funneliformis geosporum]|uniref:Ribosome biogenesis protein NOP53 n=1 Tax=Funneliformis geosporum TaxID=1117311 RepID=A0A9W4WV16_9GLOM|nr:10798_t:CDS:2 [Funneliformis geosporum]
MTSIISIKPARRKSQPSRKGKKAWRKNVNIADLEKTLEGIRAEERTFGGRICDLPDEKIFTIDTTGDSNIKKKISKRFAKLKIEQILEDRSKVPAIISKTKKQNKNDEHPKIRLEKMTKQINQVQDSTPTEAVLRTVEYDVWDDENEDDNYLHPAKKRKVKPPPTINIKPPDTIPVVHVPHPGASYNPTFEDHQALLKIAHEEEVAKLYQKQKLQSQFPLLSEALSLIDNEKNDENSSEDEVEDFLSVEREHSEREKQHIEKVKAVEEKAKLPLKKIGKYPVKKLPISIQLQEELSGSLRTLKPEGNLFRDRMVSLEERNIVEPRMKVSKKRKYKLREFERSSYKNFK